MRVSIGFPLALTLAGALLTGCMTGPPYQEPPPSETATATVAIGKLAEDNNFGGGAWLSIVKVDGAWTGRAPSVRVTPGEHRFQIRHFDGWALIAGNQKFRDLTFNTEPGHSYQINGSYCCGYFLGQYDLAVFDLTTQQQVAEIR
jgi:hypothetical protein